MAAALIGHRSLAAELQASHRLFEDRRDLWFCLQHPSLDQRIKALIDEFDRLVSAGTTDFVKGIKEAIDNCHDAERLAANARDAASSAAYGLESLMRKSK